MLTTPHAKLAIKVISLFLAAAISCFFLSSWVPETKFMKDSLESVENSQKTVMALSAATLSASLGMSALPQDFATPLAGTISDMNVYFVALLTVLFLEKILLIFGVDFAFSILIPVACIAGAISLLIRNNLMWGFSVRLATLALAVALVVPCSTLTSSYVAADLTEYVEAAIAETEAGADKLNQAMNDGSDEKSIFDKLSDLFLTAINGITDLMNYFQGIIRKCTNAIAILILTNFIMPILTFFVLKWVLNETFHITIPNISMEAHQRVKQRKQPKEHETELISAGEK